MASIIRTIAKCAWGRAVICRAGGELVNDQSGEPGDRLRAALTFARRPAVCLWLRLWE